MASIRCPEFRPGIVGGQPAGFERDEGRDKGTAMLEGSRLRRGIAMARLHRLVMESLRTPIVGACVTAFCGLR